MLSIDNLNEKEVTILQNALEDYSRKISEYVNMYEDDYSEELAFIAEMQKQLTNQS